MSVIHSRAPLVAVALWCLVASSPAFAEAAAADPWARVPPFTTLCYQRVDSVADPFDAKIEAAKAALQADWEKQAEINAKIEEEYQSIDPMEMASRMQQWMMNNPQEAMAYMQAAQAAPAVAEASLTLVEQQRKSQDAEWNALMTSYEDARLQAYAPATARHKTLALKIGYGWTDTRAALLHSRMAFAPDPGPTHADFAEGEAINGEYDRAYQALCPEWWGADGKFHAYLKQQKDWFIKERIPYWETYDAPKLQKYVIMSTPTASYRSQATVKAVEEYLDLVRTVFGERDGSARCLLPRDCDRKYP